MIGDTTTCNIVGKNGAISEPEQTYLVQDKIAFDLCPTLMFATAREREDCIKNLDGVKLVC